MDLSAVPEALMTVRAARVKMKGKGEDKGEPFILWKGQGTVAQTELSQTFAGQVGRKKKPNRHVTSVDNVVNRLVILDALKRETRISRLGQTNKCCQTVRISDPS